MKSKSYGANIVLYNPKTESREVIGNKIDRKSVV